MVRNFVLFEDPEHLLNGLHWGEKNTDTVISRAHAYAVNLAGAILNVCDCWFYSELFGSKFEFAVRSSDSQSSEILSEVQKVDQAQIKAMAMSIRFGVNELDADVQARAACLVQIGCISMQALGKQAASYEADAAASRSVYRAEGGKEGYGSLLFAPPSGCRRSRGRP
ncbi:hypothetical protein [Mesorhizobium sp.]|uniref:hypothetical protein n=1 Tax=Mesorhizobium sp. TaxID=1871066 RepID=UPI000FE50223|nr:hypothetical protein [Mesorhizobium sp.]RWB66284.1 MAG: hypothetical protein EOQ49_29190 [Mesorhizobium sp.]